MKKIIIMLAVIAATLSVTANITLRQCKGMTVKGVQCKRTVGVNKEGYCASHDPNGLRCGAMTSKGTPCKNPVSAKGERCIHHAK